jgi:hypothetical protein
MWDFTELVSGHCINTTAFFYSEQTLHTIPSISNGFPATSSVNITLDVWILVLPITTLLKVQRPKPEKLALVAIFSLGVFSCIASIVRLHSIRIYTESLDPFYDSVPINLWSMVEVNMGILCASIPATKALFSKAQRERTQNGTYQYHSRGRSIVKYGKGSAPGNKNSSAGSVIQNESYGLKDVEVERPDTGKKREERGGGGAWRTPESWVEEQRVVWPESRV